MSVPPRSSAAKRIKPRRHQGLRESSDDSPGDDAELGRGEFSSVARSLPSEVAFAADETLVGAAPASTEPRGPTFDRSVLNVFSAVWALLHKRSHSQFIIPGHRNLADVFGQQAANKAVTEIE